MTMLPTPSTSHVDYDKIYEPAEDSYLFLDTLSSPVEKAFLCARFGSFPDSIRPKPSTPFVVEVGTGSGVVLAFAAAHAAEIFGRADIVTLGTDVNPFACRSAARTVELAVAEKAAEATSAKSATAEEMEETKPALLGTVRCDLASPLREGSVDVLIFNPPYVPTETLPSYTNPHSDNDRKHNNICNEDDDVVDDVSKLNADALFARASRLLALSYAGGRDGMETTARLLAQLPRILSQRGVAYVLLCAQNKPAHVMEHVRAWSDGRDGIDSDNSNSGSCWAAEAVGWSGKTAGWEKLCIVRIWRQEIVKDPRR